MIIKPAEYVIKVFGGVRETARKIKRDPASVSRWQSPKSKSFRKSNELKPQFIWFRRWI